MTNKHWLTTLLKVPSQSMFLTYLVAREGINNTKNESRETNRKGRDDEKSEKKPSLASMQTNKWWRRSRREGDLQPSPPLRSHHHRVLTLFKGPSGLQFVSNCS